MKTLERHDTPERKRATAYHEAGHAALAFLFGNQGDLAHIDMKGTKEFRACCKAYGPDEWQDRTGAATGVPSGDPSAILAPMAKRRVMQLLAGFAAQWRVCPSDFAGYPSWFDAVCATFPEKWDDSDEGSFHDMAAAVRTAKHLYGDNGSAWAFLRRMARWTDEALQYPRLWAVVQALADRLLTVKPDKRNPGFISSCKRHGATRATATAAATRPTAKNTTRAILKSAGSGVDDSNGTAADDRPAAPPPYRGGRRNPAPFFPQVRTPETNRPTRSPPPIRSPVVAVRSAAVVSSPPDPPQRTEGHRTRF